eukprot:7673838-Ditylum_brightwellii.AAC.1
MSCAIGAALFYALVANNEKVDIVVTLAASLGAFLVVGFFSHNCRELSFPGRSQRVHLLGKVFKASCNRGHIGNAFCINIL